MRVLSFDYGTCFSTLAMADSEGQVKLVDIGGGRSKSASAVLHDPELGELVTGETALTCAPLYPDRFVRTPKKVLGEPEPLTLGDVMVPVPSAVAACIRALASSVDTTRADDRVIATHPVRWSDERKASLRNAFTEAGFISPLLLPEPVAAAHQLFHLHGDQTQSMIIYDLGGGTFDLAVLARTGDSFEVLSAPDGGPATGGDAAIGGDDFDLALIELMGRNLEPNLDEYWQEALFPTTREGQLRSQDLQRVVCIAKENLSEREQARIVIPGVDNRGVLVTRGEYNEAIRPMVERTVTLTADLVASLSDRLPPDAPILLVGGASRTPLVAQLLGERFGHHRIVAAEEPKGVVALGGARWGLRSTTETIEGPKPPPPPEGPKPPPPPATWAVATQVTEVQPMGDWLVTAEQGRKLAFYERSTGRKDHEIDLLGRIVRFCCSEHGMVVMIRDHAFLRTIILDPNRAIQSESVVRTAVDGPPDLFCAGPTCWSFRVGRVENVGPANGLPWGRLEYWTGDVIDLSSRSASSLGAGVRAYWFLNENNNARRVLDQMLPNSARPVVVTDADGSDHLLVVNGNIVGNGASRWPLGSNSAVAGAARGLLKRRLANVELDQTVASINPSGVAAVAGRVSGAIHQQPWIQQLFGTGQGLATVTSHGLAHGLGTDARRIGPPRAATAHQRLIGTPEASLLITTESTLPPRDVHVDLVDWASGSLTPMLHVPRGRIVGDLLGRDPIPPDAVVADTGELLFGIHDGTATEILAMDLRSRAWSRSPLKVDGWAHPVAATGDSIYHLWLPHPPPVSQRFEADYELRRTRWRATR